MRYLPFTTKGFFMAALMLVAAGCTVGDDISEGGNSTARAKVESYVTGMKMATCAPGWFAVPTIPTDSFPVIDGVEAAMLVSREFSRYEALLATNCDELFLALNDQEAPETCADVGTKCDGDIALSCLPADNGSTIQLKTDCTAMGLICDSGNCIVGKCFTTSCDDDRLLSCTDGIATSTNCEPMGLICGRGAENLECIGAGETCTETEVIPSCVGTVLTGCLAGKLAQVDCAAITDGRRQCSQAWIDANIDEDYLTIPGEIMFDSALEQSCSPAGTECEGPATSCDDDYLAVCIDGYWEYIDCLAYGFSGCSGSAGNAGCYGFPVQP